MKVIDTAIISVKEFYTKIEDTTKKRPIAIVISNLALLILSLFISPLSYILAIGVFSFSLFFTVAIVKNFEKFCERIEEQVTGIFIGPTEAARARGRREGRDFVGKAQNAAARVHGFFEEVTSDITS